MNLVYITNNNQEVNTEYTIINMSSVQKLQNVSKQVASVLEQITAGASQKLSFYPTSLFY